VSDFIMCINVRQ